MSWDGLPVEIRQMVIKSPFESILIQEAVDAETLEWFWGLCQMSYDFSGNDFYPLIDRFLKDVEEKQDRILDYIHSIKASGSTDAVCLPHVNWRSLSSVVYCTLQIQSNVKMQLIAREFPESAPDTVGSIWRTSNWNLSLPPR